jgi:hypothetical protein
LAFLITPEEEEMSRSWLLRNLKLLTRRTQRSSGGEGERSVGVELNLQALARVISWAWVAQIPLISLYDYYGEFPTGSIPKS